MNNKEDPKMVLNQIENLLLLYNSDLSPQNQLKLKKAYSNPLEMLMIRERERNREPLFNIESPLSVNIENFNESLQLPSVANQAEFNGRKKI